MHLDFVILCLGRTGSTHLQSLLDSHPGIRCFGELFTPNAGSLDEVFASSEETDEVRYVERLTAELDDALVVGFKLPLNSLREHPRAADVVAGDELKFIRLSRGNLLALMTSRRLLAQTRVPQSTHGTYGEATVRFDPAQLMRAFERIELHEKQLDDLAGARPTYRLTYDELVTGIHDEPIQRFLGVEPVELQSWFDRVRSRSLSETIENWDEVSAALTGTRFERFLQDDL